MKNNISPAVGELLADGKFHEVFELLHPRVSSNSSHPELMSELNMLRDTYLRMLDFFRNGYPDPGRSEMIRSIGTSLLQLSQRIDFETNVLENEGFYYAIIRADRLAPENLQKLIESYISINTLIDPGSVQSESLQKMISKRDELLERAFKKCMIIRSPESKSDFVFLQQMFGNSDFDISSKLQMLSALTLNLMASFDREVFITLLTGYEKGTSPRIQGKALTGVFIGLHLYSEQIAADGELMLRLGVLSDSILAYSHFREIVLTIIRTRNTGSVTEKFKREVLDNFKDFKGKFKMPNSEMLRTDFNGEDMELNPEWQEFLKKTGIEKKLQKFSELQSEGADLMMITFAQLKNFSFFRSVANWFLPFDATHSSLSHYREMTTESLEAFMNMPGMMCDSDKYSLALSLSQMPPEQRLMLNSQLDAQQEQLRVELESKLNSVSNPEFSSEVLMTTRSLYRFMKLFGGAKGCFNDPFLNPVDVTAIPALQEILSEKEILELVSEFYFKHENYNEALNLFLIMERDSGLTMYLAEKIGYCYEKLYNFIEAYAYYTKAELLGASSKWLWTRMMTVLTVSNPDLALDYAKRLYEADSESFKVRMAYISTLISAGKEDELLSVLYKCYYENPELPQTTLLLARTLMNRGETDKASDILSLFMMPEDATDEQKRDFYAVRGLTYLSKGAIKEGVSNLKKLGEEAAFKELQSLPDKVADTETRNLIMELIRLK